MWNEWPTVLGKLSQSTSSNSSRASIDTDDQIYRVKKKNGYRSDNWLSQSMWWDNHHVVAIRFGDYHIGVRIIRLN